MGRRAHKETRRKRTDPDEMPLSSSIKKLLASFPEPLMLYNRNLEIIYANDPAIESLGFDPTGLPRKDMVDRIDMQIEDGSSVKKTDISSTSALEGKSVRNTYYRFRNAEGFTRYTLGSSAPLIHEDEVVGVITTWKDITEQIDKKKLVILERDSLEQEVEQGKRDLDDSHVLLARSQRLSSIGALAAMVAHELRNPLGVIRTAAYNIRRKNENPSLVRHIDNIDKKIEESTSIINNLLNYSKIQVPHIEQIHLAGVLDECISSARKRFHNKKVKFSKRLRAVRKLTFMADPDQIREVFLNILNNAAQSIEDQGTIRISAFTGDEKVIVDIVDDGCGIDENHIDKVFDPFFSGKPKGTGLGLAICSEMVELHGGSISIKSGQGEGTKVSVILPLRQEGV